MHTQPACRPCFSPATSPVQCNEQCRYIRCERTRGEPLPNESSVVYACMFMCATRVQLRGDARRTSVWSMCCMHKCAYVCMYVCMYVCIFIWHRNTCARDEAVTHTYTHACILYVYIYTPMPAYVYTYMPAQMRHCELLLPEKHVFSTDVDYIHIYIYIYIYAWETRF